MTDAEFRRWCELVRQTRRREDSMLETKVALADSEIGPWRGLELLRFVKKLELAHDEFKCGLDQIVRRHQMKEFVYDVVVKQVEQTAPGLLVKLAITRSLQPPEPIDPAAGELA